LFFIYLNSSPSSKSRGSFSITAFLFIDKPSLFSYRVLHRCRIPYCRCHPRLIRTVRQPRISHLRTSIYSASKRPLLSFVRPPNCHYIPTLLLHLRHKFNSYLLTYIHVKLPASPAQRLRSAHHTQSNPVYTPRMADFEAPSGPPPPKVPEGWVARWNAQYNEW
jgi:hypothetical protein